MRWLLLALFVSLVALLIAAAGITLHILIQRRRLRLHPPANIEVVLESSEEQDAQPEV
jgi:hypothetical protein